MQLRLLSLLMVLCVMPAALGRHIDLPRERRAVRGYQGKSVQATRKSGTSSKKGLSPWLAFHNVSNDTQITAATYESQVLTCEARGNPPPTIHWLKDGKKIYQSTWESIQIEDDNYGNFDVNPVLGLSSTRSKLFLDCLTAQDEGEYTCVAENPYNRISATTTILINPENKANSESCVTKKAFGSPARIHMWTLARVEQIGSDVQMFCRASGTPPPKIEWWGPGKHKLEDEDKYTFLSNGDLVIRNLRWEDMGGYVCVALNPYGSDKISLFLYPTAPDKE